MAMPIRCFVFLAWATISAPAPRAYRRALSALVSLVTSPPLRPMSTGICGVVAAVLPGSFITIVNSIGIVVVLSAVSYARASGSTAATEATVGVARFVTSSVMRHTRSPVPAILYSSRFAAAAPAKDVGVVAPNVVRAVMVISIVRGCCFGRRNALRTVSENRRGWRSTLTLPCHLLPLLLFAFFSLLFFLGELLLLLLGFLRLAETFAVCRRAAVPSRRRCLCLLFLPFLLDVHNLDETRLCTRTAHTATQAQDATKEPTSPPHHENASVQEKGGDTHPLSTRVLVGVTSFHDRLASNEDKFETRIPPYPFPNQCGRSVREDCRNVVCSTRELPTNLTGNCRHAL